MYVLNYGSIGVYVSTYIYVYYRVYLVLRFLSFFPHVCLHQPSGSWNPLGLFPIYALMGFCLGILELVRRVIPVDIVGNESMKLRRSGVYYHTYIMYV